MKDALANGDDTAKIWTLRVQRWLDPTAFVEQTQKTKFQSEGASAYVMGLAALVLARADMEEASAVVESIHELAGRCDAMVGIVDALPADRRADKLALLEHAAFLRDPPNFPRASST